MLILTLFALIGWFVILDSVSFLIPRELANPFWDEQSDVGMAKGEVHIHSESGSHSASRS